MSRGPDAETLLCRALVRDAARVGCTVVVDATGMICWASATFTGARHQLTLTAPTDAALDGWLSGLAEADLPLRHHLVADLSVLAVTRTAGMTTATLEALTVET